MLCSMLYCRDVVSNVRTFSLFFVVSHAKDSTLGGMWVVAMCVTSDLNGFRGAALKFLGASAVARWGDAPPQDFGMS